MMGFVPPPRPVGVTFFVDGKQLGYLRWLPLVPPDGSLFRLEEYGETCRIHHTDWSMNIAGQLFAFVYLERDQQCTSPSTAPSVG